MVEYQKFMFDNFVIECDDDKCIAEPLDMEECNVDLSETEIENNEINTELPEDVETLEFEVEENKPSEIEEISLPTYSQDEFDAAIVTAEEKGYSRGKAEALNDKEQQMQSMLQQIEEQLKQLLESEDEHLKQIEQSSLELALVGINKILPSLEQDVAKKEVEAFLSDNFAKFKKEINLSFCFHPEMVAEIAPLLSKLANKNDYEGKISVHKDADMGLSDCRVEWKNGGVERNSSKIINKIMDLVQT